MKASAAALVLVLIVGGAFYAWSTLAYHQFQAAALLPSDTYFVTMATAKPGLWQAFNARNVVDAYASEPGFAAAIRSIEDQLRTSTNGGRVDFEHDLLPLLDGDVAMAAFGSPTQATSSFVVVAHSSDAEKLLSRVAAAVRRPDGARAYKGALVSSSRGSSTIGVSGDELAAYKGWLIYGPNRQIVEQTIDRVDGTSQDSLAGQSAYLNTTGRLPQSKLAFVYVDSSPLLGLTSRTGGYPSPAVRDLADSFYGEAALGFSVENDGLLMTWESSSTRAPKPPVSSVSGDAVGALGQLPAETIASISADNLPAVFSTIEDAVNTSLAQSMGPNSPRVTVQYDRWLGGEFAMGLTAGTLGDSTSASTPSNGVFATPQPDMLLVARVKDVNAAHTDIDALDGLLKPRTDTIDGLPLKALNVTPGASLDYGISGNWLYVASGNVEAVLPGKGANLTSNPRYQMVQANLVKDGINLFVDGDAARTLTDKLLNQAGSSRRDYDTYIHPLVAPMKALGGSLHIDPSGAAHARIKLAIRNS